MNSNRIKTRRQLPPLNALRAFEAVARFLSFTKAADELLVTQSAVSRQVKNLEDILGVPLFLRKAQLELTEEGKRLLRESGLNFTTADSMGEAAERVVALAGKR